MNQEDRDLLESMRDKVRQTIPEQIDAGAREVRLSARESWRMFGIMAEFVEGTERLSPLVPAVTMFGSARSLPGSPYYALAEDISRRLSDAGFAVISGGGPGIMEAANKGAYFGKSPSIGLNIQLPHEQHVNPYQNISQTFQHFFARKFMFVKFASAYVVLPGGFGTLDEVMEVLTLIQTGKSRRIPLILVHAKFWEGLIAWFKERLVSEGMIAAQDLDLIEMIDEPQAVVDAIFQHYEKRGFAPSAAENEVLLNL
jgi:uncharacterized protein (TIGR00730 family)